MAGRIGEHAIREIRERANLFEVVSDVVGLRRRGRSAVGLCPFHSEKTPSFTVSEERGFYHCFGCGEHGDVFAFVMKTQSLPFPEAVRAVAVRFGLPVPEEAAGSQVRSDPLVAANAAAATFYRNALRGPAGTDARAYLVQRGLRDDTIERFGLGWAPGDGEALARHLRAQGIPVEDALTAGLVMRRTSGGVYDRFRARVVFPIADATGRVVAFGGRILPGAPATGDPPPKYLNSPESPIFHKGRTVYGLGLARDAMKARDRVVVVEGYLDVIALAQAGIGEVVAPLGTALTADQLRVLRRFTETVIACFDGDEAGRRAAARSFPIFVEAGLWGRGVFLPAGDDPDTFVRTHGPEAVDELLQKTAPLIDAYLDHLAGSQRDAIGRRAEAAREVSRVLARVRTPFERDVLARLAADRLGVREEVLRAEARPAETPAPASRVAPSPRAAGAEEQIVELMAIDPTLVDQVRAAGVIAHFEDPTWRQLGEAVLATSPDDGPGAVLAALPRAVRDRIAQQLLDDGGDDARAAVLADCMARIQERGRRRERARAIDALRAAAARGDIHVERDATAAAQQHLSDLTQKTRT